MRSSTVAKSSLFRSMRLGIAMIIGSAAFVGQSSPSRGQSPSRRSRADVKAWIHQAGTTRPAWWKRVALDYPRTLDLNWPKPKGPWNPRKNVGQYIISTVNPHRKRWKPAAKLLQLIWDRKRDKKTRIKAADRLGHVYGALLGDWARAAFWLETAVDLKGRVSQHQAVSLADCYWHLGNGEMAASMLRRLSRGGTKLWADIGDLPTALAVAKRDATGRRAFAAFMAAGNACRLHGKFRAALTYYGEALVKAPTAEPEPTRKRREQAREALGALRSYQRAATRGVPDGQYEGRATGYRGTVVVGVTVTGGKISDVRVTSHKEDWFYRALTEVPRQLKRRQHLAGVHAVTGATRTSDAIINAVCLALDRPTGTAN